MEAILEPKVEENLRFGLGAVGALLMDTPAGEKATYRFAICFYREGYVTTGLDTTYYYTRYFANIEEVAAYAMDNRITSYNVCYTKLLRTTSELCRISFNLSGSIEKIDLLLANGLLKCPSRI